MSNHKHKYFSLVTFILVLFILVQVNFLSVLLIQANQNIDKKVDPKEEIQQEKVKESNLAIWKVEIPKINVSATIKEGTTEEIINNWVGHFKETPILEGNIGLIAGCSGYKENYFTRLEDLEEGDVILYQYEEKKKQYKVQKNQIIDEKDWTYLSNQEENKMTLITGLIGEPTKRRCVQATEII